MDAFLLSAGLGTRLRPLTDNTPKPLIELGNRPLIDRNLECLKTIGCERVIINTSYLAQKIVDYVGDGSKWGLEVVFSYEPELLDTGGGLKNIFSHIQTKKFIIWNADVYIDPKFCKEDDGFFKLREISNSSGDPLVTILVRRVEDEWEGYGRLRADDQGNLVSFLGTDYFANMNESLLSKVMYCGISILDQEIFSYFPTNLSKFSLTKDVFSKILADNTIKSRSRILVSYCNYYWNDIGTPDSLKVASYNLK